MIPPRLSKIILEISSPTKIVVTPTETSSARSICTENTTQQYFIIIPYHITVIGDYFAANICLNTKIYILYYLILLSDIKLLLSDIKLQLTYN